VSPPHPRTVSNQTNDVTGLPTIPKPGGEDDPSASASVQPLDARRSLLIWSQLLGYTARKRQRRVLPDFRKPRRCPEGFSPSRPDLGLDLHPSPECNVASNARRGILRLRVRPGSITVRLAIDSYVEVACLALPWTYCVGLTGREVPLLEGIRWKVGISLQRDRFIAFGHNRSVPYRLHVLDSFSTFSLFFAWFWQARAPCWPGNSVGCDQRAMHWCNCAQGRSRSQPWPMP